ncbi:hypothetical protein Bca4012_027409 [Brassica carinata]|uniref:Uncharacterized protein n=1 Tax=Brassica carinata TaxID=52824 RepID=A0A8X7VL26_BRACI|nr:hypothetical protein Bca52824_024397 [Brassica carinata]
MSESPSNSHTDSNSLCNDNPISFSTPPSPVQSPDPLLFVPQRESSPTLTLPADFRFLEPRLEPPRVEPEEQMTQPPSEPTETPPQRLTNVEFSKYRSLLRLQINKYLNILGDAPVTTE